MTPPLLIQKPTTQIRSHKILNVTNSAKDPDTTKSFYVAHFGETQRGDKLGILCYPMRPLIRGEQPDNEHVAIKTIEGESRQLIDFTTPQVIMYSPAVEETPLVATIGANLDKKSTAKAQAACNNAFTTEHHLIEAYRKIFIPKGSSAGIATAMRAGSPGKGKTWSESPEDLLEMKENTEAAVRDNGTPSMEPQ